MRQINFKIAALTLLIFGYTHSAFCSDEFIDVKISPTPANKIDEITSIQHDEILAGIKEVLFRLEEGLNLRSSRSSNASPDPQADSKLAIVSLLFENGENIKKKPIYKRLDDN
jgi:hypothetical protein